MKKPDTERKSRRQLSKSHTKTLEGGHLTGASDTLDECRYCYLVSGPFFDSHDNVTGTIKTMIKVTI